MGTAVEVLRQMDALSVSGAAENVDVGTVFAAAECQHGTNLLPIGSSPLPFSFPIFLAATFTRPLQSGSKPLVNLTGSCATSGKNCGWRNRGTGWTVVDGDWVGNTGALNTAGDDIFHGLDILLLAIDVEATVLWERQAWLLTRGVEPAAGAANGKPLMAWNDGGHFATGANESCKLLQNIISVCGASL